MVACQEANAEGPNGGVADTEFTIERLVDRVNEDLANALGNTANRVATLVHRNLQGHVDPQLAQPAGRFAALAENVQAARADFWLREAARLIVGAVGYPSFSQLKSPDKGTASPRHAA